MGKHHATNLAVLLLLTLLTADVTSSFDMNSFNNQKPCKANPCTSKQVPVPIKDYVFTSNGCGTAGAPVKGYEFVSNCCDLHDACYSVCGITKTHCDSSMKKCMTETCDKVTDPEQKKKCDAALNIYNLGASVLGCPAFTQAQKEACYCVSKEKGAAAYKERLLHFLQKHADSEEKKTEKAVNKLLKKHKGKEAKLFYRLVKKYTQSIVLDTGKKNFMSEMFEKLPNLSNSPEEDATDTEEEGLETDMEGMETDKEEMGQEEEHTEL